MSTINLTADAFEACVNSNPIVVVDFWAEWCAPCKAFSPVFEQVSEKYPAATFAKVDVEAEVDLSDLFEIRSIPHLMIFKQGILIYSEAGSMPESMLVDLVEQATVVDVSDIKAELDTKHPQ